MNTNHTRIFGLVACGLITGVGLTAVQGCGEGGVLDNLREQCGLVCAAEGIVEGNASISGIANIDAFFGAVVSVRDASLNVSATVRAELEALAASLEIEGYADMSIDQLAAAVEGGIKAKLEANISGGLKIDFQPPRCEASLEVSAKAAAECDVMADPGSVEAKCEGKCEVSADVAAMCEAEGKLECRGTAPDFQCSGSCSGTCQLEAAASCSGTCNGDCSGNCSVTDAMGRCAGSCDGMCQGTCQLSAAAECSGRCEGECTYTAPEGGCTGGARAECDVSGMAEARCEGSCQGNVEPPEVSAECKASVEAKAKAEVQCYPPSLNVSFQFAGGVNADAQAEFRAWLETFKLRFSNMLAAKAKLEIVLDAIINQETGLIVSATGAVQGAVEASLEAAGSGDLKVIVGIECAIDELANVQTALTDAQGAVEGSVSAIVMVGGAVGAAGM